MNRHSALLLTLATSTLFLTACAMDDSGPSRPRTASPLDPSSKAQQNAEQRSMEKPTREMPTAGREFPGQSKAPTSDDPSVATLDVPPAIQAVHNAVADYKVQGFSGPPGLHGIGKTTGPTTEYNRDAYRHVLPSLPPNPGTVPQTGSIPAPDGDWTIDYSWGQGLVLENAPHRNWPTSTATYKDTAVLHNPTYTFNLQEHEKKFPQNPGTTKGDVVSTAIEVPWFFVNTAMLPFLMIMEPPLAQRMTARPNRDPNFQGHLPTEGPVIPAPYAGTLKWDYPFLNPDGTVKRTNAATRP